MSGQSTDTLPQGPTDLAEVEATARDYIEGWYTGNVERMDRSLHRDLVKRFPGSTDPGSLGEVTKDRMLELTANGGGDAPETEVEILIDDVSSDIAAARVVSPDFLDYLQLAKTAEGWKIANVLFHGRA